MAGFRTQPWGVQELLISLERCKLVLPEFQRDFVWNPRDINLLLVSLVSGYPAGSLLFLKADGEGALGWRPVWGVETDGKRSPDHLVLDGQQRLTSLALALQGRGEHLFFLDLTRFEDDGLENAVVYVRRDQAEKHALADRWMQFEKHMYPLSAVFADDVEDENWFEDYAEHHHGEHGRDRQQMRAAARSAKKQLVEPLRGYEFPVIELPGETSLESVCTIFETLNKTGMKLTVFDLLTAKFWPRGLNLREMLETARESWPLLGEREFDIEANYLLQAVSLLRSQDAPKCKRGDVLELDPTSFAEDWERVCQAASSALTVLRDDCGVLGPSWMPYMALLPCLFATVVRVHELSGPKQAAAWQKVKQWFWCCCFGQRYDGPVNTLNAADYRALLVWIDDDQTVPEAISGFALDELELRTVRRQRAAIYRAVICLTVTHGARDFHTGHRLTAELLRDPKLRIEDHHIVPTGFLKKHSPPLKGDDAILNRCLIDGITNRTISDKAPHRYLKEIAADIGDDELDAILESHLIPAGEDSALRLDPFDLQAFLDERNRYLLPKIAYVTGATIGDSQGSDSYLDPSRPIPESSPDDSAESSGDSPDQSGEAGIAEREPWTAKEMVDAIRRSQGAGAAAAAEAILGWATDHDPGLRIWFSSRATGSFMPGLDIRGGVYLFPIAIYSSGTVEIQFQHMIGRPQRPFDDEQRRREFQSRLNEIKGLSIPDDRLDKRPGFRISALTNKDSCSQFLGVLDWAFDQAISAIEQERALLTNEPSIVVKLTEGAVRRHYMLIRGREAFFPADAFGGSTKSDAGRSITLHFSGTNETVDTDITDWQGFRCRAPIGRFFVFHDVKGGERISIERSGERAYLLEPV